MPTKKRKRQDAEDLPKEEQQRRARQRELRKVALDLRAKGVDYNPRKHGNKKSTPKRKPATAKEDDKPHKPRRAPTVIIVPIFWNTKAAEKDAVIAAARLCMQRISDAGIKVDLDTTNTHTPGAKFRYWEERGVKFRVELGPEDVANGTAVLAICGTPGEVAEKHTLAAPDAVATRLCQLLGNAGGAVADGVQRQGTGNVGQVQKTKAVVGEAAGRNEAEPQGALRQKVKKSKAHGEQPEKQAAGKKSKADVEPKADAAPKAAAPPSKYWGGGDDAEDDFGIDLLAVQAAPAKEGKRRRS